MFIRESRKFTSWSVLRFDIHYVPFKEKNLVIPIFWESWLWYETYFKLKFKSKNITKFWKCISLSKVSFSILVLIIFLNILNYLLSFFYFFLLSNFVFWKKIINLNLFWNITRTSYHCIFFKIGIGHFKISL